eukprot:scaffold117319_cov87-Phaeocystis_antarctica.AAC.3
MALLLESIPERSSGVTLTLDMIKLVVLTLRQGCQCFKAGTVFGKTTFVITRTYLLDRNAPRQLASCFERVCHECAERAAHVAARQPKRSPPGACDVCTVSNETFTGGKRWQCNAVVGSEPQGLSSFVSRFEFVRVRLVLLRRLKIFHLNTNASRVLKEITRAGALKPAAEGQHKVVHATANQRFRRLSCRIRKRRFAAHAKFEKRAGGKRNIYAGEGGHIP